MVTVSSFCIKLYTPPSSEVYSGWGKTLSPGACNNIFAVSASTVRVKSGFSGVNPRLAPRVFDVRLYKGVTWKGKQSMQKNFFSSIISADKRSVKLIWKQPFLPSCKQFIFPKNCNSYYSKTSCYILYIVVVLILQHYQLPLGCAMFALADILLCW